MAKDLRVVLALPFLILGLMLFMIGGCFMSVAWWNFSWDTYGFLNLKSNDTWYTRALIPIRFVLGWMIFVISFPVHEVGGWLLEFADNIENGFNRYR